MGRKRSLTRREFLRAAALGLGSVAMSGCGRRKAISLTATPAPTTVPAATLAVPTATLQPAPTAASSAVADVVLVNGKVVTMDGANTIAQAVAIAQGRILQTGSDEAIRALAGPQTQVIDLRGRTATPGFVDAHNHLSAMGLTGTAYIDINPPAVKTIAELQATIAEGCARTPSGKWVIAQGYISLEGRFPDKRDLDPVSPNHPVMLINQGGHMGAVNSYALKLAGVTAATPNPRFGVIVRDEGGEPTGALVNHAAMDIFRILWTNDIVTQEIMEQATMIPQARFASVGVTSFGDVNARGVPKVQAYFDVARRGDMTIRGYILNTIEYYKEMTGRADQIEAIRYEDEYMRFGGFKFLVDGAGAAAYTHEPHTGIVWNVATWDAGQLKEAVSTLHASGYQCSFHVVGDAAVDMALDAIEHAMNRSPRPDPRHRLEHAVLNTESALQRTRDLGVVVSTQPHAIRLLGEYWRETWGEERTARIVPTRTWLDMRVPLSISSDSPTMPWWQPHIILAAAVTRVTSANAVIGPDQCLTIEEAMRAYTMGGAYADFEETTKGSLEPGKLADLAVWTQDPYTSSAQDLVRSTMDLTLVGGKTVYQRT